MKLSPIFTYSLAIICGCATGYFSFGPGLCLADGISQIFMNLLKLVSLPIIFLSITHVATGMESFETIKQMGRKVICYTLLTTVLAATIGLILFLVIDPVEKGAFPIMGQGVDEVAKGSKNYWQYLLDIVPSNAVRPFVENNVIGVLFLAIIIALASFSLKREQRKMLHTLFSSLFTLFMQITSYIVRFIPLALFAFTALFVRDARGGLAFKTIGLYLACVVGANFIQAFVILPLILLMKGIAPWRLAKAMSPALLVAFFTKSSNATIPCAVKSAQERANISEDTANFVFPLCTTINMNGCAAFILITTLFVSTSYGMSFSLAEMIMWIFVATVAAAGSAGVPMGCFFLSSAFLAALNVPLQIMGIILPFYTLLDAFETAINVWSDSCVAALVDQGMENAEKVTLP